MNRDERFTLGAIVAAIVVAAFVAICCVGFTGCRAYYENAGMHVRTGSLVTPVEVTEPTDSLTVRALYAIDGIDLYAAKNCNVTMVYTNVYSNTYFCIVETRGVQSSAVTIEPVASDSSSDAAATPQEGSAQK